MYIGYSAEGCYFDAHDHAALCRVLLDPLGPGGPAQQLYFATARPADHADVIVHNDQLQSPAWEVRPNLAPRPGGVPPQARPAPGHPVRDPAKICQARRDLATRLSTR